MKITSEIRERVKNHFRNINEDDFINKIQNKYGIELIDENAIPISMASFSILNSFKVEIQTGGIPKTSKE